MHDQYGEWVTHLVHNVLHNLAPDATQCRVHTGLVRWLAGTVGNGQRQGSLRDGHRPVCA